MTEKICPFMSGIGSEGLLFINPAIKVVYCKRRECEIWDAFNSRCSLKLLHKTEKEDKDD